jgi:hypothetical protein
LATDPQCTVPKNGFGLMAIGSSDSWEVTVDESLDKDQEWEAEIEGPNFYITFSLKKLQVLRDTLDYLQTRILGEGTSRLNSIKQDGLTLGKFGASKITLIWDNEDFDRCFFIIRGSGNAAIRLSLYGDEIKKLSKAFQKVVEQLPSDSQ